MKRKMFKSKKENNNDIMEITVNEGFTRITMSTFMKLSDLIRYGKIPGKIMVVSDKEV